MGINLVIGCPKHRERMWVYRGHEAAALDVFFDAHADCGKKLISHDQADDGWVNVGGLWSEREYPIPEDNHA